MTLRAEEAAETLPATSVDFVVIVCVPGLSDDEVRLQPPLPSAVVVPIIILPPVSNTLTIAPASVVPASARVVLVVMLSLLSYPVSDPGARSGANGWFGDVVSIVTLRELDAGDVLPAASVAFAVRR